MTYAAEVAELYQDIQVGSTALTVKVWGYNDNLSRLFTMVIDHMTDFELEAKRFEIVKKRLCQKASNSLSKPSTLARSTRLSVINGGSGGFSDDAILEGLNLCTMGDLQVGFMELGNTH